MISRILIGTRAAIVLFLGGVHLAYTLFTHKFSPTEGQWETAMKQAARRISNDMTMWKAWIGFHVSHSTGLMLFGLIYGYLAVCRWDELLRGRLRSYGQSVNCGTSLQSCRQSAKYPATRREL